MVCMLLGWSLRRGRVFPEAAAKTLNAFVIYISLPALVLVQMHAMGDLSVNSPRVWLPISMAWIQFGIAGGWYLFFRKILKVEVAEAAVLLLTVGLGNTSFVGFPLLEAFFGKSALATGVLVDQPGSFLVLGTLGVLAASILASRLGKSSNRKGI